MEKKLTKNSGKRIEWIDQCKGLAIILVVFGHCWSRKVAVFRWINSFHLPIFFIIAGYLIAAQGTGLSKFVIIKKIKRMLVPYFTFSFLILIMITILRLAGDMSIEVFAIGEIKAILSFNAYMPTWFLACMFFSECIFLGALKEIQDRKFLHFLWITICIGVVFGIEDSHGIYFVFRRSFLGALWMEIGFIIYNIHKREYKISWAIIVVAFVVNIILSAYNENTNMMTMNLGNSKVAFIIMGILGSVAVMEMFRKANRKNLMLSYCGEHSLEILCSHTCLIEAIRLIDYKLLGNIISDRIYFEGYILTVIVLVLEVPLIWMLNKYFPGLIGKS